MLSKFVEGRQRFTAVSRKGDERRVLRKRILVDDVNDSPTPIAEEEQEPLRRLPLSHHSTSIELQPLEEINLNKVQELACIETELNVLEYLLPGGIDVHMNYYLDTIQRAGKNGGVAEMNRWREECKRRWNKLQPDQQQFYFIRLKRFVELGLPVVRDRGQLESVYAFDHIFRSQISCLEEDVNFALALFRKSIKNLSHETALDKWEEETSVQLDCKLRRHLYNALGGFALECELSYRKHLLESFPFFENGRISPHFDIQEIVEHLSIWRLPLDGQDIEGRVVELKKLKVEREKSKHRRAKEARLRTYENESPIY